MYLQVCLTLLILLCLPWKSEATNEFTYSESVMGKWVEVPLPPAVALPMTCGSHCKMRLGNNCTGFTLEGDRCSCAVEILSVTWYDNIKDLNPDEWLVKGGYAKEGGEFLIAYRSYHYAIIQTGSRLK